MTNILRIDASMRRNGSASRAIADTLIDKLAQNGDAHIVRRDLTEAPAFVDERWIGANFTPAADRTDDQKAALAASDALVDELEAADTIVIATPIYNFSVPAALKAWVDMVARVGRTFHYTKEGPVGELSGKKVYIVAVSGGTKAGSDIDFATPYLRHILGFMGLNDVEIIAADAQSGPVIEAGKAQVDALNIGASAAA
ncbi:MAG: NAD(P)H-dependent oxidoreductase [Pseudomonadota bacterium]